MKRLYRQQLVWIKGLVEQDIRRCEASLKADNDDPLAFVNHRKESMESLRDTLEDIISSGAKRIEIK